MGLYDFAGTKQAILQWGNEMAQEKRDKKNQEQREAELKAQREHQINLELAKMGVYGANPAQGPTGGAPVQQGTGFFDLYGTTPKVPSPVPQSENTLQVDVVGGTPAQTQEMTLEQELEQMDGEAVEKSKDFYSAISEQVNARSQQRAFTDKMKLRNKMMEDNMTGDHIFNISPGLVDNMSDDEFHKFNHMLDSSSNFFDRANKKAIGLLGEDHEGVEALTNSYYEGEMRTLLKESFGIEDADFDEAMLAAKDKFNKYAPSYMRLNNGLMVDSRMRETYQRNFLRNAAAEDPSEYESDTFEKVKSTVQMAFGRIPRKGLTEVEIDSLYQDMASEAKMNMENRNMYRDSMKGASQEYYDQRVSLNKEISTYENMKEFFDGSSGSLNTGFVDGIITDLRKIAGMTDLEESKKISKLKEGIFRLYEASGKTTTANELKYWEKYLLPNLRNSETSNEAIRQNILNGLIVDKKHLEEKEKRFDIPTSKNDMERMIARDTYESLLKQKKKIELSSTYGPEAKKVLLDPKGEFMLNLQFAMDDMDYYDQLVDTEFQSEDIVKGRKSELFNLKLDAADAMSDDDLTTLIQQADTPEKKEALKAKLIELKNKGK